ncbi:DsbA family protein [Patescibacteria group bacterium]
MIEKLSKNLIPIAIIISGILICGVLFYLDYQKAEKENLEIISPEKAAEIAINYINENLLQGITASLMETIEEDCLYKLHFKIGEQEYDSYVTKDGKMLFPEGFKMETEDTSAEQPKSCEDVKKNENPYLEAFVVSYCPFGLQMQRILNEIVKNIPSLAGNIEVEYIGSAQEDKIVSMHGEQEAEENLRQICIREEQSDKYWSYIDCFIKKGEVDNCLNTINVDKDKLTACLIDASKGVEYAKGDFTFQNEYKVSGSPTLFLNGEKVSEFDFGGRTAQALKTLLCCGFEMESGLCSQELTEDSAATGFSETYTQPSGSSGGSCE